MDNLLRQLDLYFGQKAPQLPAKAREVVVKVLPYLIIISLVFLIAGLLPLLSAIGIIGTYAPVVGMAGASSTLVISLIVAVVSGVLELMALSGLFKKTYKAWKLLFYAEVVMLLGQLISLNIVSFIISGIVGFYVLFQIRSLYSGAPVYPIAPKADDSNPPSQPASPNQPVPPATPQA